MSDSVRPHRLHCPWDSPRKNTGVGCHFLLQCMKVKSESKVAQSYPTLRGTMDCSPPGSSVHGIFQARVPEWGAIAFSDISHRVMQSLRNTVDREACRETISLRQGQKVPHCLIKCASSVYPVRAFSQRQTIRQASRRWYINTQTNRVGCPFPSNTFLLFHAKGF